MSKNIRNFIGVLFLSFFIFSPSVQARENVTDWYVKDFREEFVLSTDSTMTVTEWITADCGQAIGKHGIFRVVPTKTTLVSGEIIDHPVTLIGITDFQGHPYKFETTNDRSNGTVTWKIGDKERTVTGENTYKIVYTVENIIRFSNQAFDEFYWNVVGNFWVMDIDAFEATIIFPETIKQDVINLSYYTGMRGSKDSRLVRSSWKNDHSLSLIANQSFAPGNGVTLSASVPKNLFVPYQFGFWKLYGEYFWLFLPLSVFLFCYRLWRKYGDDPTWNKVVIPEYEMPENLGVFEMGMLMDNGIFDNKFVTASIIELAVKGALKIQEQENKILFFTIKEFVLEKQPTAGITLHSYQKILFDTLFKSGDQVKLSSLKNTFYQALDILQKTVIHSLTTKGLIEKKGLSYRTWFVMGGAFLFVIFYGAFSGLALFSGIASGVLLIFFARIMPKRTEKGVEVNWRIQGLKLYMNTAEKHRQQFYEKENIFETLLPCAIAFGMTKEWVKKMQDIYGETYFSEYHPAWFVSSTIGNFDVESFHSSLATLSSSIASNTGGSSGSGGSGSSGGGSGGGGGGGW
ncbi:MAG: DUF2207 domain-containing protein [Candidatus Moranbacteria bacterium]|nr:DUF2207 domain-containing protein [Candidatus Moranbacteria bacterium]MDD3964856.1 DUF2207 domain-containing protein [Candidatus Moranbacteria bacterium]